MKTVSNNFPPNSFEVATGAASTRLVRAPKNSYLPDEILQLKLGEWSRERHRLAAAPGRRVTVDRHLDGL